MANESTPSTPAATPPATPPATPTAHPEGDFRLGDPVWEGMMKSFGVDAAPAEPPPSVTKSSHVGRTMAEVLAAQAEAPPENPETPPADPATPPADPASPPATPAPETPPAAPATPPATPPAPVVEKKKPIEKVIAETVAATLAAQNQPAPATPQAAPAVDPFEATLGEAEKEELALARFAAEKHPDKYADRPGKVIQFLKDANEFMKSALKENPDRTFDEGDEDFQKWIKRNKPSLSPIERRRLEREQLTEEATAAARQSTAQEIEELKRVNRVNELRPKIEQETLSHAKAIEESLKADPLASEIVARAAEVGWDQVIQEDGILAPIVHQYQQASAAYVAEFKMITTGLKTLDSKNPVHQWIYGFVANQGKAAEASDQTRIREGRTFLDRAEYNRKCAADPAAAARHWTFTDDEIIGMIAENTRHHIVDQLKTQSEKLEKSGFARKAKPAPAGKVPGSENKPAPAATPAAAPAAPATPPAASPRSTVSASPGAGKGGSVNAPSFGGDIIETLGLPKPK